MTYLTIGLIVNVVAIGLIWNQSGLLGYLLLVVGGAICLKGRRKLGGN